MPSETSEPFATAQIIPLPRRARAAAPPDQARLTAALAALDGALGEQQQAVVAWREALADLRCAMGRLSQGVSLYQARLGQLATDVAGLNQQAALLVERAERFEALAGAGV